MQHVTFQFNKQLQELPMNKVGVKLEGGRFSKINVEKFDSTTQRKTKWQFGIGIQVVLHNILKTSSAYIVSSLILIPTKMQKMSIVKPGIRAKLEEIQFEAI